MACKIVKANNGKPGGISFAILAGIGWLCVPHRTYFNTMPKEPKPKRCPIFHTPVSKSKKRKK